MLGNAADHASYVFYSKETAATNSWCVWRVESRQTENEGGIRVV